MVLQFGPNVLVLVHSGYSSRTPQTKLFINNRNFLQFWRLEEHDQGTGRSGTSWEPTSWFTHGTFLLCLCMAEGMKDLSGTSFIRGSTPFTKVPPSWSNNFSKAPSFNITILRAKDFNTWIWRRYKHSVYSSQQHRLFSITSIHPSIHPSPSINHFKSFIFVNLEWNK